MSSSSQKTANMLAPNHALTLSTPLPHQKASFPIHCSPESGEQQQQLYGSSGGGFGDGGISPMNANEFKLKPDTDWR